MSDSNVVSLRDTTIEGDPQATGAEYKIDLRDGWVYDQAGNQIDRWIPEDDSKSRDRELALAEYASEQHRYRAAYQMSLSDPERARLMLRSWDLDERTIKMDLGTADVHLPAAMPNFASGYTNEPPVADMCAPPLLVQKPVDQFFQFDKNDAFQRVSPLQQMASEPGEVSPRLTNDKYAVTGRALAGWVSTEIESAEDTPLRILQATLRRVLGALELEREIRVATKFQTSANFDTSVVTTLASGFQWDGGASSDPINDIHTQMLNSWGPITAMIMSAQTFMAFQRNSVVRSYFGFKSSVEPMPNAASMESLLTIPKIHVGKMQYINDSGNKVYVWGNHVTFVRQPLAMPPTDQQDVATGYTFRWATPPVKDGSASGGFFVRQFYTQSRGIQGGKKVIAGHYDDEHITSKFAAGLLLNAYR